MGRRTKREKRFADLFYGAAEKKAKKRRADRPWYARSRELCVRDQINRHDIVTSPLRSRTSFTPHRRESPPQSEWGNKSRPRSSSARWKKCNGQTRGGSTGRKRERASVDLRDLARRETTPDSFFRGRVVEEVLIARLIGRGKLRGELRLVRKIHSSDGRSWTTRAALDSLRGRDYETHARVTNADELTDAIHPVLRVNTFGSVFTFRLHGGGFPLRGGSRGETAIRPSARMRLGISLPLSRTRRRICARGRRIETRRGSL